MYTNNDKQGAEDQRACEEWEDGEGMQCATITGVWHAALAWERKRKRMNMPFKSDDPHAADIFAMHRKNQGLN